MGIIGLTHPHEDEDADTEAPDSQQPINGTKDDASTVGAFLRFDWLYYCNLLFIALSGHRLL